MRFVSTRGGADAVPFSAAMTRGLAPDGGLYVPERFPRVDADDLAGAESIAEIAVRVIAPFFDGDPLEAELGAICEAALSFPIPSVDLPGTRAAVLELFHGPTAAFKDVGARFLAECLVRTGGDGGTRTVLVATSGDTGGAVAAAFDGKPGIEVGVLFPIDGVSARQRQQLTCWGGNVRAFAVHGTFDDCQRVLKAAFAEWRSRRLTTANSINVARMLPQIVYYAVAGVRYLRARGVVPGFVVPSGNVGNATAALWARHIGLPVGRILLATNANRSVPDYLATGRFEPRPSIKTLANAMDVGSPSNMERVLHLFASIDELREHADAIAVSDAEIEQTIRDGPARYGQIWDPHTATAVFALDRLDSPQQVIVATAHPAKFDEIVEPLVGRAVEVPAALAEILSRPGRLVEIEPDLGALDAAMSG